MGIFKKENRNLLIIALIALVNMLGYGIIIPLIYAYSRKYGLSDFENGLLFSLFSVCQFISTPIIGRLSDKYGRRPLLVTSILGTVASFFIMAFAPNALFLYIARALDGLTAGNIPVVFAVISDSTEPKDRTRAFGIVGAAFSFGFVFGPAVAALTVGFGSGVPFIIAGVITLIAALMTIFYLPETNKHVGEIHEGKLFDIPLLFKTLVNPNVGPTFLITLIFLLAFSCSIIFGFQPYVLNVLHLTTQGNAILFVVFGIIGLITQTFLVQRISKWLGMKRAFMVSLGFTALGLFVMTLYPSLALFVGAMSVIGIFNSIVQTLIPAILSQEADAKSQGSIMGLNASYQSIGMIVGPILGGFLSSYARPLPFIAGSLLILVCLYLSRMVMRPGSKASTF